jgi:molybdopterin-guanine dinucleotide biosynthesis protein A
MPVSAAILCGGEGRRMGGADKGQLLIHGQSFIERQLEVLRPLTPHLMLIRGGATRPCPPDVRVVKDEVEGAGALGGVYTALRASATDRIIVLACDMPFVTTDFLAYLLDYREDADVVIPRDEQGRHPLCGVFHRRIAPALKTRIDAGMLRVDDALVTFDLREVDSDATAAFDAAGRLLLNVNTPKEYRDALSRNQQGLHSRDSVPHQ